MSGGDKNIQPENLAYDLRQIYAKLVGFHLIEITENRQSSNFYEWFRALQDLNTIIKFKYANKGKGKGKEPIEKYNKLKDAVTKLANAHKASWTGTNKNQEESATISEALRELEEFLYQKMHEAKMFGEGGRIPGL